MNKSPLHRIVINVSLIDMFYLYVTQQVEYVALHNSRIRLLMAKNAKNVINPKYFSTVINNFTIIQITDVYYERTIICTDLMKPHLDYNNESDTLNY